MTQDAGITSATRASELIGRLERLPTTRTGYIAMVLLTLAWIVEAIDIGIVGSTIFLTSQIWSLSAAQVGLLAVSGTIGILFGLLPSGALSDRYGRRRVLMYGLLWVGVFTLLGGLSANFETLLVLRFVAGLGMGAVFPIPYILILELAGRKSRYRLVSVENGILAAAYLIPSLAAGVLVQYLADDTAWRAAYLFGVLPLIIVPLLRWLPESPQWQISKGRLDDAERLIERMEREAGWTLDQAHAPEDSTAEHGRSLAIEDSIEREPAELGRVEEKAAFSTVFSSRYRTRSLVAFLAYSAGLLNWYVMLTYAPQLLSAHGFTDSESFFITAILVGIIGVGQFSQGFLASAKGLQFSIGFYGFAGAAGITLLALAVAFDLPVALAGFAFAITGLLGVGVVPMQKVFLAEQYPTRLRGKGVGTGEFVARLLGGILAIYYVPALLESQGQPVLFLICALALLISTVGVVVVDRISESPAMN